MAAAELPIPADLFLDGDDAPPISDEDIDRYFDAAERLASEATVDLDVAAEWLSSDETTSYPAATATARWRIEDDGTAAWAAGRFAEAADELAVIAERRDAYIEKIRAWYDVAARRPTRTLAFFEERLGDYGLRVRAADPRRKSIPLPSATIRTTESQPAIEVIDEEAVAAWAEALPEEVVANVLAEDEKLVERRPKVFVAAFRKLARIGTISEDDGEGGKLERPAVLGLDGEPVPGASVRPGGITPKVTANP